MTLATLIDQHPDDDVALIEGGRATTYGELRDLVARTRAGLVASDLAPRDRVAVVCANNRAAVVSVLAATSAGMVAVLLDPNCPGPELREQVNTVRAAIVLTGSPVSEEFHPHIASPASAAVHGVDPLPDGPPVAAAAPDEDALAVMLFTSGTAGTPKAAMLSHRNLTSNQQSVMNTAGAGLGPGDVVLATIPISHMYGFNMALLTTLRAGGTVVLAEQFSPDECAALVREHHVDRFAGVPPMWRALIDSAVPDDAFAGVSRISSGASALHPRLWTEFKERFGVELCEGYGLTETSPTVTSHVGIPIRPGTVGKPAPGVEVKVVDHDGHEVPFDDSGEIMVRGPGVFLGYWENEEATKAVLDHDGWLATRDIGVISDDGYLALIDRAKDLIIVSGFNVYPFEVETVLVQHPKVDQTVVIGRDDDRRGERVVAFVTVPDGSEPPTLDELVAFCRERLARYKCPTELEIVTELPIGTSGKTQRRKLS
ncbi:MAG: AMP-binding protein [Acidimicrobiales bacterium]